jgi:hypothetical protein
VSGRRGRLLPSTSRPSRPGLFVALAVCGILIAIAGYIAVSGNHAHHRIPGQTTTFPAHTPSVTLP